MASRKYGGFAPAVDGSSAIAGPPPVSATAIATTTQAAIAASSVRIAVASARAESNPLAEAPGVQPHRHHPTGTNDSQPPLSPARLPIARASGKLDAR